MDCFEKVREKCEECYEAVYEVCENAIYKLLNKSENDSYITNEGIKIQDIGNFEIGKIINFTVPYGSTVGKLEIDDNMTIEAIGIESDKTTITIFLENLGTDADIDAAKKSRDAVVESLKATSDIKLVGTATVGDRIATANYTYNDSYNITVAVIGLGDKTILICNKYQLENQFEAENCFVALLGEIEGLLKEGQ